MGWRFRKSIKISKNTRINLGKHGYSVSTGVKGARVTVNNKGKVTRTVGIPGTGIYNTKQYDLNGKQKVRSTVKEGRLVNNPYILGFNSILTKEEKTSLKIPFKIKIIMALGVFSMISAIFFIPMLVFALIFLLVGLLMFPFTKNGRYTFKMSMAETKLMRKDKESCIWWTRSAMKTKPNDIVAQKILNELMQESQL